MRTFAPFVNATTGFVDALSGFVDQSRRSATGRPLSFRASRARIRVHLARQGAGRLFLRVDSVGERVHGFVNRFTSSVNGQATSVYAFTWLAHAFTWPVNGQATSVYAFTSHVHAYPNSSTGRPPLVERCTSSSAR